MTRWYDCPAQRPRKGWLRRVMESLRGLLRWRGRPEGRKRILPGMDCTQLGAGWNRAEPGGKQ